MIDNIVALAPAITILCFIGWAVLTVLALTLTYFRKIDPHAKYKWFEWQFMLIRLPITVWLSMWCFRSMFTGPLW